MGLINNIKYETKIKNFKDISPESVLDMLKDIKSSISKLESLKLVDLKIILDITEKGKYKIEGEKFNYNIDLSDAQSIIRAYRKNSEGGCTSCVSNFTYVIDAQDHSSEDYCGVSNPNYFDIRDLRKAGLTKKIRKHYDSPCKDWKPKFSPTIEELIK